MTDPWNIVGWLVVMLIVVALCAIPAGIIFAMRTRNRAVDAYYEARREVRRPTREPRSRA